MDRYLLKMEQLIYLDFKPKTVSTKWSFKENNQAGLVNRQMSSDEGNNFNTFFNSLTALNFHKKVWSQGRLFFLCYIFWGKSFCTVGGRSWSPRKPAVMASLRHTTAGGQQINPRLCSAIPIHCSIIALFPPLEWENRRSKKSRTEATKEKKEGRRDTE